ncbi:MAG: hypothetical protein AB7K68_17575 [Bacteriovoracia bacterium]
MSLGDFFKNNADVIGNSFLDQLSEKVGLPTLPPLQFSTPNQNPNNYVEARPAPAAIQPETAAPAKTNYMLYGGIAVGVILVVFLLTKKR